MVRTSTFWPPNTHSARSTPPSAPRSLPVVSAISRLIWRSSSGRKGWLHWPRRYRAWSRDPASLQRLRRASRSGTQRLLVVFRLWHLSTACAAGDGAREQRLLWLPAFLSLLACVRACG